MTVPPTAESWALMDLAAMWDQRAADMERECKQPPCSHAIGYRQAAYELREALAPNDSLKAP